MSRPRHGFFANTTAETVYCARCGEQTRDVHRVSERGKPDQRLCTPCFTSWRKTQPKVELTPGKPSRRVGWPIMTAEELQRIGVEPEWIPCAACKAPVFMARCVKKDGTIGKIAPLLRPRAGGLEPNIVAWYGEDPNQPGKGLQWLYRVVTRPSLDWDNNTLPGSQPQPEFINHFADCPAATQFRKNK